MIVTPELLLNVDHNKVSSIVDEARQDWQLAQTYFELVSDPILVDFAIFWERAARLRYVYLLRYLKKEGYCLSSKEVIRLAIR
ncbi:MAG: DUF2508 family protein [Firmicutes bacterium]|nr:DUF2508 family protein [Bacillota bacterium]